MYSVSMATILQAELGGIALRNNITFAVMSNITVLQDKAASNM